MPIEEKSFDYIRRARKNEWQKVIKFTWCVFSECNARFYSEEGIASFRDYLSNPELKKLFDENKYIVYFAIREGEIAGLIALRYWTHIALLFVSPSSQKTGIGTQLILKCAGLIKKRYDVDYITVNAAPTAEEFYRNIGFRREGKMSLTNGMPIMPMKLYIS